MFAGRYKTCKLVKINKRGVKIIYVADNSSVGAYEKMFGLTKGGKYCNVETHGVI